MNTIQLKIRVNSINVSHIGQDSRLMITGKCQFQHYDSFSPNKKKICTLKYKAFGYAAQTLQQMNANTIYIIRGSIDIYPPNEQYPNHQTILNISTAIPVNIIDTTEYNQIVSKPQFNTTDSLEAFPPSTPSVKETSLEEVNTTATITKTVEPITETIEPITETIEPITKTVETITETVEPITKTVETITKTVETITETVEPISETDITDQSNNSVVKPESLSYKELKEFVKVHNLQSTILDSIGKPFYRCKRKELIKALTA